MQRPLINHCPATINQSLINESSYSLVTVEYFTFGSVYDLKEPYWAISSGFIINAAKNWIITNKHSVSGTSFGKITIRFFTGEETAAKLYYADPQHDFSILFVDYIPNHLKLSVQFSQSFPPNDAYIFMLGDGNITNYKFEEGYVISAHKNMGLFSSQILMTSIINQPGSSGAPIFSESGQIVGLHFSSNGVYSAAVPSPYIMDAINNLHKNIVPSRQSIGAYFEYCNLSKLKQYSQLPYNLITKNEDALCIKRIIPNTPADGVLKVADILWSVKDTYIGANLYLLEHIINSANKPIKLSVYRYGKEQEFILQPYNLTSYQITKALYIGGIIFFAADELSHLKSGVPLGRVFTSLATNHTAFRKLIYSSIEAVNGIEIKNLEDLVDVINISNGSLFGNGLVVVKKHIYHIIVMAVIYSLTIMNKQNMLICHLLMIYLL
jgi:S1-C subfamily serine protease